MQVDATAKYVDKVEFGLFTLTGHYLISTSLYITKVCVLIIKPLNGVNFLALAGGEGVSLGLRGHYTC